MQPARSMVKMPVNPNSPRIFCATRGSRPQSRARGKWEGVRRGTRVPSIPFPVPPRAQAFNSQVSSRDGKGVRSAEKPQPRREGTVAHSPLRAVHFDLVLELYLVPSRKDLGGLRNELWWQEEDYLQFRICALTEDKDAVWRRARRRRDDKTVTVLPTMM